jgi:hypothetical protein
MKPNMPLISSARSLKPYYKESGTYHNQNYLYDECAVCDHFGPKITALNEWVRIEDGGRWTISPKGGSSVPSNTLTIKKVSAVI